MASSQINSPTSKPTPSSTSIATQPSSNRTPKQTITPKKQNLTSTTSSHPNNQREQKFVHRSNQYFNHHRNHEPKDYYYTQKLAQRSVARAALHLGMESMSQDTLHVLSDALLCYMEKIGSFMSHFVERDGGAAGLVVDSEHNTTITTSSNSSTKKSRQVNQHASSKKAISPTGRIVGGNRWSGHVNVLDVLHAVECCTSHTVNQVDFNEEKSSSSTSSSVGELNHMNNSWEGLAEFLFGKDWLTIGAEGGENDNLALEEGIGTNEAKNDHQSTTAASASTSNGRVVGSKSVGKALNYNTISSTAESSTNKLHEGKKHPSTNSKSLSSNHSDNDLKNRGWNAPYPDEVPVYPIRKHIKSLETLVNVNQACRDNFTRSNNKIKTKKGSENDSMSHDNEKRSDGSSLASMYDQQQLDVAKRIGSIPHAVFEDGIRTFWGDTMSRAAKNNDKESQQNTSKNTDANTIESNKNNNKRKHVAFEMYELSMSKRPKFEPAFADDKNNNTALPSYVPKFLPPFPPTHTYQPSSKSAVASGVQSLNRRDSRLLSQHTEIDSSSLIDTSSLPMNSKPDKFNQTANVKSALISLGQDVRKTYWGAMVDQGPSKDKASLKSIQLKTIKIENLNASTSLGNASSTGSAVGSAQELTNKGSGSTGGVVPVKPMSKASSVRTSRILEGSMDTSV